MTRPRVPGLMFEAVAEAGPDMGGGGEPAAEPVEPAGDPGIEGGEPAATPAAAEPFDPSAYFETDEGRALLDQQVAARVPQPEPEPTQHDDGLYGMPPPPNPWESDDFSQDMAAWQAEHNRRHTEAILGQVTSAPGFQHAEQARATEWVNDTFTAIERDLKLPEGQHLPDSVKELAVAAAAGARPANWNPGQPGFDPGKAVADNAKALHALIQSERAAALAAYQGGIDPATPTPGASEPPAGGLAAIHSREVAPSHRAITSRFLGHE